MFYATQAEFVGIEPTNSEQGVRGGLLVAVNRCSRRREVGGEPVRRGRKTAKKLLDEQPARRFNLDRVA